MISPYLRREPRSLFQAIRDLREAGCIDLNTARELLLGVGPAVDINSEGTIVLSGGARYPAPWRTSEPGSPVFRKTVGVGATDR